MSETLSPDPVPLPPTWWQRRAEPLAAGAVFVLTVVLTVLSFPPFHTPEFACAFAIPGAFWAYTRPRLKVFAWTMFAAQAVTWTILLGWLHHVTWGGLFLLGPFVGAWVGVWYLAAWWTLPRMVGRPTLVRLAAMLGLAGAWVLIEWSRTWLLGGFPWLPLAASQWERMAVLQIAALTGAGGVSFVLIALNLGFAAYAHRLFREGLTGLNKRSQEFFLALFLVLASFSYFVQETFSRARYAVPLARVAFVQPDIPQDVKWDAAKAPEIFGALEKTTLAAIASRPEIVLWPEAVTPFPARDNLSMKAFVESLAKRVQAPLVLGSIVVENQAKPDERWFNGALLVVPGEGVQANYYAKRQLVPFGEFVPLRPILGWLAKFVPIGPDDFARGLDSSPLIVPLRDATTVVGPLICYEDTYPALARASVRAGADALVVVTNNGWFGRGGAAYQHAAHAVLRAVETRRPVLRCGNAGWSGWIDEYGAVRKELVDAHGSIYFRGTDTVAVTRDSRWIGQRSFFVEHGDWFVLVCAVLGVGAFLLFAPRPAATGTDGRTV
ncbi:MAG: apolipoprotein N-acyltransferase [Verrucomicrobia bacterium]|nr:apolipoprotein N-acyltransferase [Verrucomicrobiota bacterium]